MICSYDGRKLCAKYNAELNVTEVSARAHRARCALCYVVYLCHPDAHWTGSTWIIDGDVVAEIRVADRAYPRDDCTPRELVETLCAAIRDMKEK